MQKDKHPESERAVEGYGQYMQHDSAALFTAEGRALDQEAFVSRSRGGPRAWTIIVSPLDGYRLDLEHYIRAFMAQVERDMGVRLDWLAAVHRDSLHHHSHILLRGEDSTAASIASPSPTCRRMWRTRARETATRHVTLGLTTAPEQTQVPERSPELGLQERVQRLQQWIIQHSRHAEHDTSQGMEH